ncbi:ER membrane protein complex subunit 8 [Halotydeus destructor]|nr:ER membrane protein complex subunit 8 [Halotydeus destructor]
MSSNNYTITSKCYVKLLMHCLKYPHATVNGLLLAEKKAKDGQGANSGRAFLDVVPLFHLGHGLTPMMEAALLQVSSKCAEKNLVIAGYYQANKYFHDSAPDAFAYKIAEKIWEQNNDAVLMMVHNFGLAASVQDDTDADQSLHLYTYHDAKWKNKPSSLKHEDQLKAFECLNELVYSKQRHYELNDFDNHLDDISADWSNKAINQLIDSTIMSL